VTADVESVGKAVRELRARAKGDFSLEIGDTLASLCTGDKERTGAALWQLFRDGDDVFDHRTFAEVMAKAPKGRFTAADFLAYLQKLAANKADWLRLKLYDREFPYRGWNESIETMFRALDDLGPLAAGWQTVAEPVQGRLALALARRGALHAADLPEPLLGQAAHDYLTISTGTDTSLVFEGLEAIWPAETWRAAVVAAALSPAVKTIKPAAKTMSGYVALAADADIPTIAAKMDIGGGAEIRRWYRDRYDALAEHIRTRADAMIKRVKSRGYIDHDHEQPFLVFAERALQETGQLDERFDPVLVHLAAEHRGGVVPILKRLDEKRSDRLLLKSLDAPGAMTGWDQLKWLPTPALARHCVDQILDDTDDRVNGYATLTKMGNVGARVVCDLLARRRKAKQPVDPEALVYLLHAFDSARLPEVVDECLLLLSHRTDRVRELAREQLFLQTLDHMLPRALAELLASADPVNERLVANFLIRWSHDARARALASEQREVPRDGLARARLVWAATLEPALAAVCERLAHVPEALTARITAALGALEAPVTPDELPAADLQTPDGFAAFLNWMFARRLDDDRDSSSATSAVWKLLAGEPASFYAALRWSSTLNIAVFRDVASPEAAAALAGLLDRGVFEKNDEIKALQLIAPRAPHAILSRLAAAAADANATLRDAAVVGLTFAGEAVSDTVVELLSHASPRARAVAAAVLQREPTAAALPALDKALAAKPAAALKKQLEMARDTCRILAERALPPPAPTKKTRALAARATAIALDGPVIEISLSKGLVLAASNSAVQLARRGRAPARLFERVGVARPLITLAADEECFAIAKEFGPVWVTEAFAIAKGSVASGVELDHDDGLGVIVAFPGGRVLTLCISHNAYTPVTMFSAAGKQLAVHSRSFAVCAVLLAEGKRYLLGEDSGKVSIRDAKTGKAAQVFRFTSDPDEDQSVAALVVFDRGRRACARIGEQVLAFMDLARGKKIAEIAGRAAHVDELRGSPDAPWVFAVTKESVEAWTGDGRLLRVHALAEPAAAVVATSRGAAIATGRELRIWNPQTNTIDAVWTGDVPLATAAAQGRTLCIGDERGQVHEIAFA